MRDFLVFVLVAVRKTGIFSSTKETTEVLGALGLGVANAKNILIPDI